MNNINISEAAPEDAVGIQKVQRETWMCTYPNEKLGITPKDIEEKLDEMQIGGIERMIGYINDKNSRIFVAKDKDTVVAYIGAYKSKEENKLAALYVLSSYHNQGIGTRLMEKVLDFLGEDKKITLDVTSYNTQAIEFYKKFGFIEIGPTHSKYSVLPSGKELPDIGMVRLAA